MVSPCAWRLVVGSSRCPMLSRCGVVYPHWRVCRTGWFRRVSSLAVSRFGVCFCVLVSGDKSSMAWARALFVVLLSCPPPVSALLLSSRGGSCRGEFSSSHLRCLFLRLCFIVFIHLPVCAGQFLWCSETVHDETLLSVWSFG